MWLYCICFIAIAIFLWLYKDFNERLSTSKALEDITTHTYLVIGQLQKIENALLDAEASQRGFIITGDSAFLEPYFSTKPTLFKYIDTLKILVGDNPTQLNKVTLLKATIVIRLHTLFEALEKKKMDNALGIKETIDLGQKTIDEYKAQMQSMKNIEWNLLVKRQSIKQKHEALTPAMFKVVFAISSFFVFISILLMIYELRIRTRSQKELEQKIIELHANNEEVEQYAYVISHNLQEPLRKVRTFGSLLLHKYKNVPPEQANIIARMEAGAEQMQNMLADLITFTNLFKKKKVVKLVSLNQVLIEVIKKIEDKNGTNLPEIKIGTLPNIMGIQDQLEILFEQLFDNSIKFRSPHRQVIISVNESFSDKKRNKTYQQMHVIVFADNGKGFDERYKSKVFQLFQRLDDDKNGVGKGIGLTICKKIMFNHHGSIDITSVVAKGTSVIMCFPK